MIPSYFKIKILVECSFLDHALQQRVIRLHYYALNIYDRIDFCATLVLTPTNCPVLMPQILRGLK